MVETEQSLLKLVNASGFLFQLRVEHEIANTQREHRWKVVGREYRWTDPESGDEGFIDLVLEHGSLRLVIECKRVLDGNWVFLLWQKEMESVGYTRLLWTDQRAGKPNLAGWDDFGLKPESPQSAFCVVRGQSKDHQPMLERLSGIVLKSIEALAEEELRLSEHAAIKREHRTILYIPAIVTTAQLKVCRFHPGEVDIQKGQLSSDREFEPIPFIRFRKGLTTKLSYEKPPLDKVWLDLEWANLEKERAVFIVQAAELSNFLRQCQDPYALNPLAGWPWDTVRKRDESG